LPYRQQIGRGRTLSLPLLSFPSKLNVPDDRFCFFLHLSLAAKRQSISFPASSPSTFCIYYISNEWQLPTFFDFGKVLTIFCDCIIGCPGEIRCRADGFLFPFLEEENED